MLFVFTYIHARVIDAPCRLVGCEMALYLDRLLAHGH